MKIINNCLLTAPQLKDLTSPSLHSAYCIKMARLVRMKKHESKINQIFNVNGEIESHK